tara:strand:- start:1207 stop:1782 length:576 start_codon:yes stop_codon:yes gene_type:complete
MDKKTKKKIEALTFETAFKYPFKRPAGLLNILWILVPIIGWFALIGYNIRIIKNFVKGNFKELPLFNFSQDLNLGFFMFLKLIPFIVIITVINWAFGKIPFVGFLGTLFISLFIVPVLIINFFVKETIESYFDFNKVKFVFDNLEDYVITVLKSIGLGIIFLLMFVILVGIPASTFTKNIFFADFYRRYVK